MESDTDAIAALCAGDLRGLDVLLGRYQGLAIGVAVTITGDFESARDAVSEAFLRLPHGIHSYDLNRPFAPWFLRIVTNEAIRATNRLSRLVTGQEADDILKSLISRDDPAVMADRAELGRLMANLLAELEPKDRAVIALRYYSDLTEHEVADAIGSTEGAVHVRLSRARRQLRAKMRGRREFRGYYDPEHEG